MVEPLKNIDAEKLIKQIVQTGTVFFSQHARTEMENDKLEAADVTSVLRGGYCEGSDFERGSWRYRQRTARIVVAVAFGSETELTVVTAWRVIR